MSEQTDTHRRCKGKCREWKWKHEFQEIGKGKRWRRWVCKECMALLRSHWEYAQDASYTEKRAEAQRRRRRNRMNERAESVAFYVEQLKGRGWTRQQFMRAGLRCVYETDLTSVAFVQERTVRKVREVFMREAALG